MLLLFFILAYAWAWAFWTVSVSLFSGQNSALGLGLMILGGFGPSLAGLLLTFAGQRNPSRDPLWSRAFVPRRLPVKAALASILTPLLLIVVTLALGAVLGRNALAHVDVGASLS